MADPQVLISQSAPPEVHPQVTADSGPLHYSLLAFTVYSGFWVHSGELPWPDELCCSCSGACCW
jgi:hypothetical protein